MTRREMFAFALATCALSFGGCSSDAKENVAVPLASADAGTSSPLDAATRPADAQSSTSAIDEFFTTKMQTARVPGLAVATLTAGKPSWSKGYGLANISQNRPVTPDTLFMLASVSKVVVGAALMGVIEDSKGALTLDSDIDGSLPFSVRHPNHPNKPITFRMLLTHTSSLVDGNILLEDPTDGDATQSLHDWLVEAIAQPDAWSASAPGTAFEYSNTAVSLAGYAVEAITKKNLQEYCKEKIFGPLAMKESSWFLKGLDPSHIAMPYEPAGTGFIPHGFYGFPDYPDGQLRSSVTEMARFLAMIANKGTFDGATVLTAATVAEMMKEQVPAIEPYQGLILFWDQRGSTPVIGHNGAFLGISTDMWLDPKTGDGYVLLTNGQPYFDFGDPSSPELAAMRAMNEKLLAIAHDPKVVQP